jgi:hypothetical protein
MNSISIYAGETIPAEHTGARDFRRKDIPPIKKIGHVAQQSIDEGARGKP